MELLPTKHHLFFMSYSPQNILITGAAGFIGANFVHLWHKSHPKHRLVALDALTYAGNYTNLQGLEGSEQFRFVHGNILDQGLVEKLLREEKIDTIVHFAAESHVDRSIHSPDGFLETNILGTHSLLKAARGIWLDEKQCDADTCLFHHVSTDEVYGTLAPDDPAFSESTAYAPNSPYAASKASSDHLVRAYGETYGLPFTISNCSNNYGPYQFPEKLIPLIIANILDNKPLPIYGDGKQIRDWLYVDDHNRAIDLIIHQGRRSEAYNIGGNNEWHNIDIVTTICAMLDERFEQDNSMARRFPKAPQLAGKKAAELITYVKDRLGHDRRYAIDAHKISSELGFTPQETFASGIAKTVDWYLSNEAWWRAVMLSSW